MICLLSRKLNKQDDNIRIMKTLDDIKENETVEVISIEPCRLKKRLLEMGFVKGVEINVVKYAPLRDPIELVIKGYHVSLRRSEAKYIQVE